jgi:hypothetical protein
MDEMTLTLSSPITEEQFDAITDVDFDNTDCIWFHTKHGKDVEFVKRKKGKWIPQDFNTHSGKTSTLVYFFPKCSVCGNSADYTNYCPVCGADMRGDDHDL